MKKIPVFCHVYISVAITLIDLTYTRQFLFIYAAIYTAIKRRGLKRIGNEVSKKGKG